MLFALQRTLPLQALRRFLAICGTCAERFENAGLLHLLLPALEQAVIALVTFSVGVNSHSRGQSMVGAHRLQGYFARKNSARHLAMLSAQCSMAVCSVQ